MINNLISSSPKCITMANFKTCNNGHNYDEAIHKLCPYCPGNNPNTTLDQTMSDFKKTQLFNDGNSNQFAKTMVNEETANLGATPTGMPANTAVQPKPVASAPTAQHPFSRTSIVGDNDGNTNTTAAPQPFAKRKLVGWLVSFTNDELGQDYKLYVGKNKIGSAAGCDILVNDSSISSDHSTILFREPEFLIKDNFSTNGTKINGVMVDEGKLKDGDELKLGNTTFKFKTAF
jgi:hypothetical protein